MEQGCVKIQKAVIARICVCAIESLCFRLFSPKQFLASFSNNMLCTSENVGYVNSASCCENATSAQKSMHQTEDNTRSGSAGTAYQRSNCLQPQTFQAFI
ncbi:hypothetical protein AMECASPLE_024967 [Ameca splendens]|uniref:Uncharacterized protein n=1 Tax=Ameca splendens TaxID=208324 RepID=A0ABV1A114_9TELE